MTIKFIEKKIFLIFLFIFFLVLIDQLTKYFFYNQNLSDIRVFNVWISWGIKLPYFFIIFFNVILLWVIFCLFYKKKLNFWIFVFIFAGGLGNLIDRLILGGVRDFIYLPFFPVFNLADVYLDIWILLLFLNLIKSN